MLDRGLRRGFPDGLEEDARTAARAASRSPGERRDLRALATFTIDPASARDFDDAISAETLADGACRIWVHIADVCAHVDEGGALDREARRRATSVYVPGTVEPMLPHALSSEACSLMPDVDRLAVTVELELEHGRVRRSAFYRSLVRSDARLDYDGVDRIFAGEDRARDPWAAAARLRPGRRRRGGGRARAGRGAEGRIRGAAVQLRRAGRAGCDRAAGADRVPPPDREPDDRGQRSRGGPRSPPAGRRACTASTSARSRSGSSGSRTSWPRWRSPPRRCRSRCPRPRRPSSWARSPTPSSATPATAGTAGSPSARSCCVRSSRPTTPRATSATPACARPPTATSPPRSAATPTSSATARCCPPSASGSRPRVRRSSGSWASGPPNASGRRPRSSATQTTSPAASCSSGCCAARVTVGSSRERWWG